MQVDIQKFLNLTNNKCLSCAEDLDFVPFPLNFDKYSRCRNCNKLLIVGGDFNSISHIEVDFKSSTIVLTKEGIYMFSNKTFNKLTSNNSIETFVNLCKYYLPLL